MKVRGALRLVGFHARRPAEWRGFSTLTTYTPYIVTWVGCAASVTASVFGRT